MGFYHLGRFTETTQKPKLDRIALFFALANVLYSEGDQPPERYVRTNYRFLFFLFPLTLKAFLKYIQRILFNTYVQIH